MRRAATFVVVAALAAACGGESKVIRVYDGHIVAGRYVSPEAYAWFLRGVLAEDGGDLDAAITAYVAASKEDDEDAAIWTRLGAARCRRDPKDALADEAFARALAADATAAGALGARAQCMLDRGNVAAALPDAQKAAHEDPANVDVAALLVHAEVRAGATAQSGDRAVALTLAYRERPAAWDALIAWARSKARADLVARGFEGLLGAAPARAGEVERGALELLGDGQVGLARRVAAAITDAPQDWLVRGPHDATVARLAVDEALARGDEAMALRRATRGHVELAEVAARALALEHRDVALSIAHVVSRADPGSTGARMVLAAAHASGKGADKRDVLVAVGDDAPPAICALVLADRIAELAGADAARDWLAKVPRRPMATHDPLVGPLAVDLAARGVVGGTELGPEQRIELAARRREPPPGVDPNAPPADIDAKHALLLASLTEPTGAIARALVGKLASAAETDPLVAFAIARVALAAGAASGNAAVLDQVRKAAASAPADPLALSALLELATKATPNVDLTQVRSRLMAVARTPAERALAGQ